MAKRLWNVFIGDTSHCYFSDSPYMERHHIFEGRQGYKERSENRGFVIPLRHDLHPNGVGFKTIPENQQIDDKLKQMVQEYYGAYYGSREQFRQELGCNYLGQRYQHHID